MLPQETPKQKMLREITSQIFNLSNTKLDEPRKKKISEFIISTVNGDKPEAYLAKNISLADGKKGLITYILTDLRLIKIDILNNQNEIKSQSYPLNTIIGIEHNLIDNDRTEFAIAFQNGSIGLRYSNEDKQITDFFQQIEQPKQST